MLISFLRSGNANLLTVVVYIISALLTIFLVLPLHEAAHGFVAYKLGDDTAKRSGRLTLNPIAHIDYIGAALILIIGFGWAKPVSVDARRFKNPKVGMALTALAGPLSNVFAAVAAGLLSNTFLLLFYKGIINAGPDIFGVSLLSYLFLFFEFIISINIGLAVFNFLPVPPLDGSKILMAFLPNSAIRWISEREGMISMVLFIVVMLGGFNGIISIADRYMYNFISWLTWLPFSAIV